MTSLKPLTFTISRTSTGPNGTLGVFTAQVGEAMVYKCYTLEDPVRPEGVKVWGDTAIPAGKYPVSLRFSNRFRKELPGVQNVPGFEGILLHSGNDKLDTHGCPLLGTQLQAPQPKPRIGICAPAVSMVVSLLKKHGTAILTVKDPA